MRTAGMAISLLLLHPARSAAEWQIKPFMGLTFGGDTTFIDVEKAVGKPNPVFGVSGVLLGNVLGIDADVGRSPGFFNSGGQNLLLGSRVTTLTGNVVIAMPRRLAGYSLRPYFVGGAGLMNVSIDGRLGSLNVSSTLPAWDVGGGATGFLTDRVGLSWELRRFGTIGKGKTRGDSVAEEQLAFWRASMAITFRYGP
jgi:hypothetical protein